MRISRDKVNKLAHTVADTLAEIPECDFLEDRNTIRQEARKALEKLLAGRPSWTRQRAAEDRVPAEDHPRRLTGVGDPLPQVLQRRGQEARHLAALRICYFCSLAAAFETAARHCYIDPRRWRDAPSFGLRHGVMV